MQSRIIFDTRLKICSILLAPVVRRSDSAIHWINLYPVDNTMCFAITYLLDGDLSLGLRYPPFIQLAAGVYGYMSVSVTSDIRLT